MSNRIIKESICTSDSIDGLTWFEEVFFYRLIVNCDDYGRTDARSAILKARLFPLKSVTERQIEDALNKLSTAGIALVYEYDQKPFLQLVSWERHQTIRTKKSKYPPPENICIQMKKDASSIQSETESESESESEDRQPVIEILLNDASLYPVYDNEVKHYRELYADVDILQELRKMAGWAESNPKKRKTRTGISRFINNWLAREQDKGGIHHAKTDGDTDGWNLKRGTIL